MHLVRAFGSSPSAYHDGMLGLELLARDRARSDDPESDDGRDPVRPPAEPPIHPFTGKFADPEHTVAYRSQAFRMMMPLALFAHRRDGTHDTGGDRGVLLVIAN